MNIAVPLAGGQLVIVSGAMEDVGSPKRTPWVNMPTCAISKNLKGHSGTTAPRSEPAPRLHGLHVSGEVLNGNGEHV